MNFDLVAELDEVTSSVSFVHVRIKQRTGRQTVTTVEGLGKDLNLNLILKTLKRQFCCYGTIKKDDSGNQIITLGGDQRSELKVFLVSEGIVKKEQLKIHGY